MPYIKDRKKYEKPNLYGGPVFKFQVGDNRFRLVEGFYEVFREWRKEEGRNLATWWDSLEEAKKNAHHPEKIQLVWAFVALNRADGSIGILEINQSTIQDQLQALDQDPDWGDWFEYDVNIKRSDDKKTMYQVVPSKPKPLTQDELTKIGEAAIDLEARYKALLDVSALRPDSQPADDEEIPF